MALDKLMVIGNLGSDPVILYHAVGSDGGEFLSLHN